MEKGAIMELDWVQLLIAVPALLTVIWAIVSFTLEWRTKQRAERRKDFALLVYPFVRACEELQSRIYNILELNGLVALRAQDPKNLPYAEETLYLIAQYFGWERAFRHSPSAQDPKVQRLTEAIRITFATSRGGVGAFCFFRGDQRSLAEGMITKTEGPLGSEFDTVPLYQFKERLEDTAKLPPSTEPTLKALREAHNASELKGRDRLAEVQNHLVDLLNIIEGSKRFTLFAGRRKKARRDPGWVKWAGTRHW
jgi:hypothetical protein